MELDPRRRKEWVNPPGMVLMLTLSGTGTLVVRDGGEYPVDSGEHSLFLLTPATRRYVISNPADPLTVFALGISVEFADGSDFFDCCRAEKLEFTPGLRERIAAAVSRLYRIRRASDRRAAVDFSAGFAQLSGVELVLADYCLTLSLTALEGISAVAITAQGRAVGQQPKQIFYERDVLLSDMGDVLQTVEVTLYFLNSDGALEGEKRTLEIYEGQTLAENLVAALLAGPENRELTAVIPEDFMINAIRADEGVCYVNISQESLASLPQEEAYQRLILWSLSDSLYSVDTIQELRLVSGGEELTHFGAIPVEEVAVRPQG